MEVVFKAINGVFDFVGPMSDFLWNFPTNLEWYARIPLLGNLSLAIILLVGSGIFFSLKLGFIQVTHFKYGVKTLTEKRDAKTGISPLASFFLSTAMRVGPGNIVGVAGAIAVGGPGALFWMWVSAFFGMATAYMEGTLAQIFKEKKGDEFVGGLPFYGRKLLGDKAWIGIFLSLLYILYALCSLPAQGFNVVSSAGSIVEILIGEEIASDAWFYYIAGAIVVVATAVIVFGGIKKVTKWTDRIVPVMAGIYILTTVALILIHFKRIPSFFTSVFGSAFRVDALGGGVFGTILAQGVKRGLMSNEAGQGTITMAAAAADAKHPCDQGMVSSLGVFLDTIVICTLTGFMLVIAPDAAAHTFVSGVISVCFCLFAYTCLIGLISFSEIVANRISTARACIYTVRIVCLSVAAFGILCNIAGLELGNLWAFSDLGNILIVYFNIPIVYAGARYVFCATAHYKKHDGTPFTSDVIGREDCACWDKKEPTTQAGLPCGKEPY